MFGYAKSIWKKNLEKPLGFNREGFAGVSVKVSLPTYMKVAFFLMLNSFWEEIGRFTICMVKLRGKYSVSRDCLGLRTIYLIIYIYSRYKLLSVYNNLGTQHAPKSSMFKKKRPCFFFEKKWEYHNIFLGVYRTQMFVPWPLPSLAICFSTCKRTVFKTGGNESETVDIPGTQRSPLFRGELTFKNRGHGGAYLPGSSFRV